MCRKTEVIFAILLTAVGASAQDQSRQVLEKVCGSCHSTESVITGKRSRAQWQETIDKMVTAQGAKGTPEEFATVLDYLSSHYGLGSPRAQPGGAGPDNKQIVDDAAADRGRKVWAAECIQCHGTNARGTDNAPNVLRSEVLLHDREGGTLGPFLRKGHPLQSGARGDSLTAAQVADLSNFLYQRLYDTLRGSPIFVVHNVVTGNAEAGKAYFNGAGRCNTCHSATGDLAGIGSKYTAEALQERFLNPRPHGKEIGKPVTLTVTPPNGEAVTGTPMMLDDFDVALRDGQGNYHSWKRTPELKVVKNDPYAAHDELLAQYTNKDMHDILAYLVTLK